MRTSSIARAIVLLLWLSSPAVKAMTLSEMMGFFVGAAYLEADFQQIIFDEKGVPLNQSEGHFQLAGEGQFIWEQSDPLPFKSVSNGQRVWEYDRGLNQVIIRESHSQLSADISALFQPTESDLLKQFMVQSEHTYCDDGCDCLKLIPKYPEEMSYQDLLLTFTEEAVLKSVWVRLPYQQTMIWTLSQVKRRSEVPRSVTFKFKVPKGVDVLDMRG